MNEVIAELESIRQAKETPAYEHSDVRPGWTCSELDFVKCDCDKEHTEDR
jgi:hypothetical protein